VEDEVEEHLAGVDGGVSFVERSMSSDVDVLESIIPSRRTTGVVGGELDKSMISSNGRRGGRVSPSRTNALGVGGIVECSTKDAAAIGKGRLCMVEATSPGL